MTAETRPRARVERAESPDDLQGVLMLLVLLVTMGALVALFA